MNRVFSAPELKAAHVGGVVPEFFSRVYKSIKKGVLRDRNCVCV